MNAKLSKRNLILWKVLWLMRLPSLCGNISTVSRYLTCQLKTMSRGQIFTYWSILKTANISMKGTMYHYNRDLPVQSTKLRLFFRQLLNHSPLCTTHANKKQRRKCKNAGEVPRGAIKSYREFLFYTIYWHNQEKCPVETFITLADIEPGPSPQSITLFLVEAHPNMQAFTYIPS